MTTISEYIAKTAKNVINLDRFNAFINGVVGGTVTTDTGTYRNFPSIVHDLAVDISQADADATRAETAANHVDTITARLVQAYAFPNVTAGEVVFTDVNGAQGHVGATTGGGSSDPDTSGLTSFLFPSVTPGLIVFVDKNGAQGDDPRFATLRTDVDRLLSGAVTTGVRPSAEGDVLHIVTDGQSLDPGTAGRPVYTTTPVTGGLRASVGVRVADSGSEDPANWGPFSSLFETNDPTNAAHGETPWSSFVLRINERLADKYKTDLVGLNQSMLMTSVGVGGASVESLSTSPYVDRLRNAYEWAAGQAAAASRSYNPLAMTWLHGNANNNDEAEPYYNKMKALWAIAEAKANDKRGYASPLIFLTYQPGEWANGANYDPINADSFLWIQERNETGLYSCPAYAFPHGDTVGHLTTTGYRLLGAHMADTLFDYVYNKTKRPVMRPVVQRLSARELILRYPLREGARLVRDTSAADDFGDVLQQNGIRLVPTDNTTYVDKIDNPVPTVSIDATVEFRGADMLLVRAVADIPTNGAYEVRQGWYDCKHRNATYIRDNAGDILPPFDVNGLNARLHNWAPVCRVSIP